MRLFPDILCAGLADFDGDAFGFVNVAAEKMCGLIVLDEIADCGGAAVQPRIHLIESRTVRRSVTNEHERTERGEWGEVFGDLRLGVFAGRIERRLAGIAEAGHAPAGHLEVPAVQAVET